MNEPTSTSNPPENAANWAKLVDTLSVGDTPSEAINLNVQGKRQRPTARLRPALAKNV